MRLADHAIASDPNDRFTDFCLWDYEPLAPPTGRWRSETLLLASFSQQGVLEAGRAFMDRCRAAFGPFRVVWGIKEFNGNTSWEFYFYDYDRTGRTRSITALLGALAPTHRCTIIPPDNRAYFMFSLAFTADDLAGGEIDEIDVYIGNPGSSVSSGICYLLNDAGMRLKNFYFFFDVKTQRLEAMDKLTTSAHFGEGDIWPAALAWPEMMTCKTVVVANKPVSDALYFSRVTVHDLLWFMNRTGFAADLSAEIARNKHRFDHLFFDTGYDYRIADGQPVTEKISFYGYF